MSYAWVSKAALGASALLAVAAFASGCIEDADCGICDPDSLVLESISGINYASEKVHVLSPPCEGERCPEPFTKGSYFIEDIGPCEETPAAQDSPSAEEFCKIAPLVTTDGIEFVFNNLLDPQSIELVRKRPDNPQLFEVYDWKVDVLHIEGPITRWNGDYERGDAEAPDLMTRMVNLSCLDNLGPGFGYSHEHYEDPASNPCNDLVDGKPRKMFEDGEVHSYRGMWSAWGNSCSSTQEGPDTCCTFCEWLLSTKIERYGVDETGLPRNPLANEHSGLYDGDPARPYQPALACRTADAEEEVDQYARCSDFRVSVDRDEEEQRWTYEWCVGEATSDCPIAPGTFALPRADLIRETHPNKRPRVPVDGLEPWQWPPRYEKLTAPCRADNDCTAVHELDGTACMGIHIDTHEVCDVEAYLGGECTPTGTEDEAAPENAGGFCRPAWFVDCVAPAETVGAEQGYCADQRFNDQGSAACKLTTANVECIVAGEVVDGVACQIGYGERTSANAMVGAGYRVGCEDDGTNCDSVRGADQPLSLCDWNESGTLTAAECCVGSLAGPGLAGQTDGFACDPFYQSNLVDRPIYERDTNLPDQTKSCRCPTDPGSLEDFRDALEDEGCFDAVAIGCFDGTSDDDPSERMLREERAGEYAVKFVTRPGGIIYDPAIKGIDWKPADTGGVPRADIEQCAMDARSVDALNRHDGWRAQDPFVPDNFEDFDRAMCSGQTYRVVFTEPDDDESQPYIVDKVGNTLEGKSVYTFETPQFHVVPGSGFPTDNLRVGACDDYNISFSNKYDVSPENLAKIQLYRLECEGVGSDRVCEIAAPDPDCNRDTDGDGLPNPPEGACCDPIAPGVFPAVAGGPGCYADGASHRAALVDDPCARPCLTVDVRFQARGDAGVEIDSTEFKQVLEEGEVYRMIVPAAATFEDASNDPSIYDAVFWDVCGMPLVSENAIPYTYDFEIDAPKCKEDQDRDGIPFSCDNADASFNPEQEDIDLDGIGDVVDLCPVAGGDRTNSADSDSDGVGNVCDTCREVVDQYNTGIDAAGIPPHMWVRNIPFQDDADSDGIGDACDNCVWTPNCERYGDTDGLTPYRVGDPIDYTNAELCQTDTDLDFVGDVCEGEIVRPEATAPIGFGNADDFDQDGLSNLDDGCPRQPVLDPLACEVTEDCPAGRTCDGGWCNHLDSDDDGVGDHCDTCPRSANANQALEGGMQEEDKDGDFVGVACETAPACQDRKDPRPFGFFRARANDNCCTTALVEAQVDWDNPFDDPTEHAEDVRMGDLLLAGTCKSTEELSGATCKPLRAPHPENSAWTLPVRTEANCREELMGGVWVCRKLPPPVEQRPGIVTLPEGCEEALTTEGVSAMQNLLDPLTNDDFADQTAPFDALWQNMCFLPQVDQDYDGFGDPCDLCPFAYDPENAQLVDENGRLWPNAGAICHGDYLPDEVCRLRDEGVVTEDDSGSESGSDSGGSGDSGTAGSEGGSSG
jgi:hypothetical protein